ncbi:hypothetical protein [Fervidobacterium sp.]
MIIFFSALLSILSIMIRIYTIIKGPMINAIGVITTMYVYLFRPLIIVSVGSTFLYANQYNPASYQNGWLYASTCLFMTTLGYVLFFPRIEHLQKLDRKLESKKVHFINKTTKKVFQYSVAFSILFLLLMFLSAGSSFLAHNRNAAMSAVNPTLRYLYPFVQLGAGVIGFYGITILLNSKKYKAGIFWILVSFIITMIIYQRGITVSFITTAVLLFFDYLRIKRDKISTRKKLKLFLIAMLLFVVILFSRDIYNTLVLGRAYLEARKNKYTENSSTMWDIIKIGLISRPDGDIVEVWMILMSYIQDNGLLYGISILRVPFALTSSNYRLRTGQKIGLDLINEYYSYDAYWYRKYGFNLNSSQELVMNFGIFGIFFSFFLGILEGMLTRRFYTRLLNGRDVLSEFLTYYGFGYLFGSFAAFQWFVFIILYGYVLAKIPLIRFFKFDASGVCRVYNQSKNF